MSITELKIRIYGDPCLREKCKKVKEVGPAERMLIQGMIAAMQEQKGVGLAAPQVGINQRIFVADIGNGPTAFINPKISKSSGKEPLEEGCLSIPGVTVTVERATKIVVQYLDASNEKQEEVFEDLMARVVQHEFDHLDGKLILDYAAGEEKEKVEEQLKDLEKK